METFEIRNLTFYYPEQSKAVLDDISFSVSAGEFLVLCGKSGCGKSTLLRHLKTPMVPTGSRKGTIVFEGQELESVREDIQAYRIGFVQQSPDNQIVTDKVWHELAFGLESLGFDTATIRERVAEMASFFGIQSWFYKDVSELSGGQKQLLNLASIMAMQPSVLILDEPTSQLDPIAASDFLAAVGKINRDLGTTIIITEHRLEEVLPMADRVLFMEQGKIIGDGSPTEVGTQLKEMGHGMFRAMPAAMQIWAAVDNDGACPVTVRDGRNWLKTFSESHPLLPLPEEQPRGATEEVIHMEDVWFRYEKDLPDVVKGVNLSVEKGEFYAILGGNGTGKSTTLSVLMGLRKAYRGDVKVKGKIAMLPQNPQTLFVKKTAREDLFEILNGSNKTREEQTAAVSKVVALCELRDLLDRHPYDLSGGEQQRLALAKVLLMESDVLLMDEPTKGLDAEYKQVFAKIIKALQGKGVTIVMVTHDIEFCAQYADRCAMFFDGNITMDGTPRYFFAWNSFYTTAANRISREMVSDAITVGDIVTCCGGTLPKEQEVDLEAEAESIGEETIMDEVDGYLLGEKEELPVWRKVVAALSGGVAIGTFIKAVTMTDLSSVVTSKGLSENTTQFLIIYGILIAALVVLAFAINRRGTAKKTPIQMELGDRKLPKRTKVAVASICLLIPVTLFVGSYCFGDRKYYFISLLILLECLIPFALIFEGRKPKTRELVILAVLCAICVAGRAAFFMLPNFKPVLGLVIIAGVAFGAESGFLIGSMTMLVSNILFGQGPWTPWQMFTMGFIGFLAGILYKKGILKRSRVAMSVFGALSTILIYGGIMNPASALMWTSDINWNILLSYYITGFPVDLVHASATVLTIWFAAEPMLEKFDRIKVKYGLVE